MAGYEVIRSSIFDKWLRKLKDRQAKSLILARLLRVEDGHLGDIKFLQDEIYEMRFFAGAGYRIYYCHDKDKQEIIVLLCGGDKSSKTAQQTDIKRAIQIKKDYEHD